ncbi:NADPH-dependent F420 reductase [Novipirellula sp.]|uniref:NADPH-dependent F420 reductase n=1 Tax=Novipirellula sp. TaxID=2795430 RepID=UPI0035648552
MIAEAAPGASVVKTFNTMWARVLKRDPQTEQGKRVLFLSGDDADANKKVVSLVSSWGFEPVDLGAISEGGLLMQFGGPLTTLSLISQPQSGPSLPEMDLSNN